MESRHSANSGWPAFLDQGDNLASDETAPLPAIGSLLQVMRYRDENAFQYPKKDTTWHQFTICNEIGKGGAFSSHLFCSLNHDDPAFTVNSIQNSVLELNRELSPERTTIPALGIADLDVKGFQGGNNSTNSDQLAQTEENDIENKSLKQSKPCKTSKVDGTSSSAGIKSPVQVSRSRQAREGPTHELFSNLQELLSCDVLKTKRQNQKSVSSSMKKIEKKGDELNYINFCASKEHTDTTRKQKRSEGKGSTQNMSNKSNRSSSKKPRHEKKGKPNKTKQSSNCKSGAIHGKTTSIHEDGTEDYSLELAQKKKKLPITFVSETQSSQSVSDSTKSIALFFDDKEKTALKGSMKSKETSKRSAVQEGKRNLKEKRAIRVKLERKAFLMYATYWRPRLKKAFPGFRRVNITDLLKTRWAGVCRKTKRRYEKAWQEQSQNKVSNAVPLKSNKRKEPKQSKSRKVDDSKKLPGRKRKREQSKVEPVCRKNSEKPEKKTKKNKRRTEKEIVDVVNWVQCDCCKNWRILPGNDDVGSLPKRWYCKMNKDKMFNSCSIPQVR